MPTIICCIPIILALATIVLIVHGRGRMPRRLATAISIGLAVLLVLLVWNSIAAIRLVNRFKGLRAEDVRSISFFDESRNHWRLDRDDSAALAKCRECEVTDPKTIDALVASFSQSHEYFPNREGARDRYLVRIDTASARSIWFILGRGTRSDPRDAWIEFNSNVTDGWHYGVFCNPTLLGILAKQVPLQKWPQAARN